jgi:uncharacterized SAM-binding protein YcdF (DUF218 family)
MDKFIDSMLHPMTWLVIGCFFLWLFRYRLSKGGRRVIIICLVLFAYITTTPILPRAINVYLEGQYPPVALEKLDTAKTYHIIVLGGGMGYDDRLPATSLLETVMLARLVEGIRVYRNLPHSLMVTSGYSSINRTPQGVVAREAAISLGVDSVRVFAQGEPSSTSEEADAYTRRFGTQTPLIIATSATHIPRAVYLFKKKGVATVIAAPAQYRVKLQNPFSVNQYLFPRFKYWGDMQAAMHEIVGLWWAKWKD